VRTHAGLAEPGTPKLDARYEWIWALLGFSALAVFWTWPVAANLSSRIPHDAGDPVLNIWILWWNAQATPLTDAWWNAPMMWPVPGSMALSEHLLGLSIVATPLQLLGAGPIAAYNVCLLLTYALSGFFAYLLGKRLTGSTFAGICAGIAFGFSPYRASQLAHIQVLSSQWMPLALLGLHAYLETGARRWLVVFGLAWLLQALSNGYFLLFFPVLIGAWLLWFVDWRRAPRRGLEIVAAWTIASLPLLPVLLKYHQVHEQMGLSRSVMAIRVFSASMASFFHAAPMLRFWREGPAHTHEQYLFTGLMVVVLAAIGLLLTLYPRTRRDLLANRAPIVFYSLAMLLMCVLALGPGGAKLEPPSPFRPYTWLLVLPGYNGLRVPARFYMVGSLCLAVAASLAVGYLAKLAVGAGRIRAVAASLIVAGLLVDGMTRAVPVVPAPGRVILPTTQRAAVLELPLDDVDVSIRSMYRSIFHGLPLVNGYSGHFPPHYGVLSLSLWRGDTSPLFFYARRRPLVIFVDGQVKHAASFKKLIEDVPGIQSLGASSAGSIFLLPAQPAPREPPVDAPLLSTVRDAGRYTLEFDVGATHSISAVAFPLKKRYDDLAERIRIETSEDGRTWQESWLGWTGGMAVEATLADPQLAPMRIPLPVVRARYVRIYPAAPWMKTDLTVQGQ
jgi:hypothetical protein